MDKYGIHRDTPPLYTSGSACHCKPALPERASHDGIDAFPHHVTRDTYPACLLDMYPHVPHMYLACIPACTVS